jgi:hypothetical protein
MTNIAKTEKQRNSGGVLFFKAHQEPKSISLYFHKEMSMHCRSNARFYQIRKTFQV